MNCIFLGSVKVTVEGNSNICSLFRKKSKLGLDHLNLPVASERFVSGKVTRAVLFLPDLGEYQLLTQSSN